MSPESGNVRSLSLDSGKKVWTDPAKMAGFRTETSGSSPINDRTRSYPVGLAGVWLESGGQCLVPVAGFRRRQVTGDQMLLDSGAGWIPTIDNC